ncbi:AraC family transcriptional regulator [Calothrix parasitica NIES-267]|uniref:AraC family transcriptional regulator n=1 Tax=Calothrix parasitica NIES-267 TaxID=1973488 RepID=A0A1Z4LSV6_9CYAN|nr:AraC family transcriptional regulator [Calothrix parasitica NIES-267]
MEAETLLCSIPGVSLQPPIFEKSILLNGSGISYVSSNPGHFKEHTDPHFKIAIPFENASIFTTWQTASGKRKQKYVRQGNVSIVPADLPHETTIENKLEMIVINFERLQIEKLADELIGKSVEIIEKWAAQDTLIRQLGLELRQEFIQGSPRILYAESVVNILSTHLIRHYSKDKIEIKNCDSKISAHQLKKVIDYINENLEDNLTLAELAVVAKMSQYRFARGFKNSTGFSPHKYLILQRIERAQNLLNQNKLSIAEISYQLGFTSQSHFTTAFRKITGITPKSYRDNQ